MIVVSYFALVSAIIINVESTGNALGDATIIFLIFDFIPAQTALGPVVICDINSIHSIVHRSWTDGRWA